MDLSKLESPGSARVTGRFAMAAIAAHMPVRLAGGPDSAARSRPAESPSRREERVRELELGRSLGLLREGQAHLALGYVRLEHYLLDRLGFSLRTAQELMRASSEAEAGGADGAKDDRAGTDLAARMIDPDPLHQRLRLRAPAWISSTWRDVRAHVRRLAGSMLPAGACLEALLAEASAGGWEIPEARGDHLHACAREGGGGAANEIEDDYASGSGGGLHASASRQASESGPGDTGNAGSGSGLHVSALPNSGGQADGRTAMPMTMTSPDGPRGPRTLWDPSRPQPSSRRCRRTSA